MKVLYLAVTAVLTATGGAGALLLQLPHDRVSLTGALPIGAELGAALAGPFGHLQRLFKVDPSTLAHLQYKIKRRLKV